MFHRFMIFLKYYLPVFFWAGLIFYLSGIPNLHYTSGAPEVILRKGAHFTEYAILAWLLFRIFYRAHNFSLGRALVWSFVLAACYGASDEFHQHLVIGRDGRVIDACYDAFSALAIVQTIALIKIKKSIGKRLAFIILTGLALLSLEICMIETGGGAASIKNTLWEVGHFSQMVKNIFIDARPGAENHAPDISKNIQSSPSPKAVKNISLNEKADSVGNLPAAIKINVPFTPQAPLGLWDQYHEEACEETALIMLEYYFTQKSLTPQIAEDQIQKMIAFEIKNYGDYKDTDAQQNINLFNSFYGQLPARNASPARVTRVGVSGGRSDVGGPNGKRLAVVYDFSENDLKTWLANGNPVIVPTAGQELDNPHYTPPGPLYHNLVLIGYSGNNIITNDAGTKFGAGYEYNIDILYHAIHDFTSKPENIDQGRKAMIIVE